MRLILRLSCAVAAGVAIYASYEPHGWWVAGIGGVGLLYCALSGVSRGLGAVLGGVQALTTYLLLLPWVGEFVGAPPFLALAVFLSLWGLLLGALGSSLTHPLAFSLWYVAVEWARSTVPFGGFAWVRLAWGQIDGPLADTARFGGPALVTFVAALLGCWTFAAMQVPARRIRYASSAAALLVAVVLLPTVLPTAPVKGTTAVAAVQGNVPRMGLDFNAQRRAVLANHVAETQRITQPVDLVIWPENASDVNPYRDREAAALLQQAAESVPAPLVVGTITRDHVGDRNTTVVYDPVNGLGEYHHKKYLQPFGEYMPLRDLLRPFSPYVDRAGNFQPGTDDGVLHVAGLALGVATCYEVAFDAAGRDAVRAGAQLMATPTNNATFGFTDMTYQQLAMSRMRAIELDRAVVVAATSGVSALVSPTGEVLAQTGIFESAHLVADMPLKDSITPAVRFGPWVELAMVIIGGVLAVSAQCVGRRSTSENRSRAR